METQTIKINGVEVELNWGEGSALGKAVHTVPSDDVGAGGPSDGETFEVDGKKYRLGSHDYSTDQPGNEDDEDCTCSADIYAVED
jgi:hypothetical protein